MRTEEEIRKLIEKSLDSISKMRFCEEREYLSSQVDTLLWVIGEKVNEPVYKGKDRAKAV